MITRWDADKYKKGRMKIMFNWLDKSVRKFFKKKRETKSNMV